MSLRIYLLFVAGMMFFAWKLTDTAAEIIDHNEQKVLQLERSLADYE